MKSIYTHIPPHKIYAALVKVTFAVLLLIFSTATLFAQTGKLKLKADIVNVDDAETHSLITLFRIPHNEVGTFVLGQFIVQGNDWFKTHLKFNQEYMVEIAATNGLTKRFYFDTDVPEDMEHTREKMQLAFDMGWSETVWPVVNAGKVSYEHERKEFAFDSRLSNETIAMELKK